MRAPENDVAVAAPYKETWMGLQTPETERIIVPELEPLHIPVLEPSEEPEPVGAAR